MERFPASISSELLLFSKESLTMDIVTKHFYHLAFKIVFFSHHNFNDFITSFYRTLFVLLMFSMGGVSQL